MELVYLWVEKYKNIKNQGFNFSSNFDVKFTPSYEDNKLLEKSELEITPKKNPLKDFFGKNINITAIVGENGSGKSNILELLFNLRENESDIEDYFYIIEKDNKYFVYYFNIGILKPVKELKLNTIYKIEEIKIEESNKKFNFHAIYFSNLFLNLPFFDNNNTKGFHNISTSYLINKYSKDISSKIFLDFKRQYDLFYSKSIENVLIMIKDKDIKLPFNLPKTLNIKNKKIDNELTKELLDPKSFLEKAKLSVIANIPNDEKEKYFSDTKKISIDAYFKNIRKQNPLTKNLEIFLNELSKFENNMNIDCISIDLAQISNEFLDLFGKFNESKILHFDKILDIFEFSWEPMLSTGQETFLFQFANFNSAMIHSDNKHNNYLILIDEGESTLHPNWQKKYINYLYEFFDKNYKEKNIQLLFSSHSPFLLSDLPKENVIFLEKDKETGKCVNANKKMKNFNTFGANIHTLLSNGFFMSHGLMGEFAKNKINEIKKFYEIVKFFETKNKKYKRILKILYLFKIKKFNHIQSIIGEKFLQTIIKNYLDDLHIIFSDDKTLIDKELAELEKRKKHLESLKNAKN